MNVLVIDIGGTHVKLLVTGQKKRREFVSGGKIDAPANGGRREKIGGGLEI